MGGGEGIVTGSVTGKLTAGTVGSAGTAGVGTGTEPITGVTGDVETLSGAPVAGAVTWPLSTWVSCAGDEVEVLRTEAVTTPQARTTAACAT